MSKANQLGAGRFGGSARPVSARRAAIGAATGVPTEGLAPPTRLPVSHISPNPDNPRTRLGDLSELATSLKEHGQKQAITVMNRDAYVKANPGRESDLASHTTHVVVDGSSRLAAALEAGLTHVSVMVDDEQGGDGEAILESALVANIHRSDLDPLDEARALQRLLAIHGSQVKLARRLSKSQGWVSQRLALLNLVPELQAVVGEEPVELLRAIAKEPRDRQEAALEELKAQRARKEAERKAVVAAAAIEPAAIEPMATAEPVEPEVPLAAEAAATALEAEREEELEPVSPKPAVRPVREEQPRRPIPSTQPGAVQQIAGSAEDEVVERSLARAGERADERAGESVPEPRHSKKASTASRKTRGGSAAADDLPYDNGARLATHLIRTMSDTELDRMLAVLAEHQRDRLGSDRGVQ